MKRPPRFSVLIVPSDGSRPIRFSFSRSTLRAGMVSLVVALAATTLAIGDYARAKHFARGSGALYARLADQQAMIDSVQRRAGEMRVEIEAWRAMQAKIWEPFGPDVGRVRQTLGIGGASPPPLPAPAGSRPSALQELDRLAETVNDQGRTLRTLERLMARAGKALAALPSRWPVRGAVNSEFGFRRSPWSGEKEFHRGMDIAADTGALVHAPAPATVVFAGPHGELGVTVILDHGSEISSVYGHLSRTQVSVGQRVDRGQLIGLTGNTGRSSGPHLHYEILARGQPVNPRAYLWD